MNRFLKKICTGILCGVLGVVSIGTQEAFAADAKEMRAVWISTVYSADYPSTTNNAGVGLEYGCGAGAPEGGCAVSV